MAKFAFSILLATKLSTPFSFQAKKSPFSQLTGIQMAYLPSQAPIRMYTSRSLTQRIRASLMSRSLVPIVSQEWSPGTLSSRICSPAVSSMVRLLSLMLFQCKLQHPSRQRPREFSASSGTPNSITYLQLAVSTKSVESMT